MSWAQRPTYCFHLLLLTVWELSLPTGCLLPPLFSPTHFLLANTSEFICLRIFSSWLYLRDLQIFLDLASFAALWDRTGQDRTGTGSQKPKKSFLLFAVAACEVRLHHHAGQACVCVRACARACLCVRALAWHGHDHSSLDCYKGAQVWNTYLFLFLTWDFVDWYKQKKTTTQKPM